MMHLLDELEKEIVSAKETIELLQMEAGELRAESAQVNDLQQKNSQLAAENQQLKENQAKWEQRLASLMRHFKDAEQVGA
ncbi:Cell division protein ZapB [Sinobacterium norvegicum]|uniref:Cell division protein ZapB n=1 Tax=Sinobacterium norvegicum TaxID=1641715 RepID=A0ABN8EIX0_9GAMM|nr:cell division protein ZapB [Sinobacterium norvegicum]CAH0991999.1 Cell division protein ZapB [Sinobacterium norvegicum]